eukprot:9480187-Alexandrium_andersonii.AAC.1
MSGLGASTTRNSVIVSGPALTQMARGRTTPPKPKSRGQSSSSRRALCQIREPARFGTALCQIQSRPRMWGLRARVPRSGWCVGGA